MRDLCFKCMRPKNSCYCQYIKEVDTKIKFVFLMHPKELKKNRTGTGRLAHISLPDSEIIMGIDFTDNKRLNDLLNDPQYYPVLMYPGPDAWNCKREGFKETIGNKKLLVILIDSTWFCSKKMIKSSKNIMALPKISFAGNYKSIFTFKTEPAEYCVSTIESCYYLIKELQTAGIENPAADPESLMNVFKKMIQYQLQKENDRIEGKLPNTHAKDHMYTQKKVVPTFENTSEFIKD